MDVVVDARSQKLGGGSKRPRVHDHPRLHMELEARLGQIPETLFQQQTNKNVKLKGKEQVTRDTCHHRSVIYFEMSPKQHTGQTEEELTGWWVDML